MKPEVKGVLRDVETEAEYQGTIYEQTAVLETENNTIAVFDGHTITTKDSIGEARSFVLLLDPRENGIEVTDKRKKGISETDEKISKWSYDFYGQVVEQNVKDIWFRNEHDSLLIIDIGEGTVLLSTTDTKK